MIPASLNVYCSKVADDTIRNWSFNNKILRNCSNKVAVEENRYVLLMTISLTLNF